MSEGYRPGQALILSGTIRVTFVSYLGADRSIVRVGGDTSVVSNLQLEAA